MESSNHPSWSIDLANVSDAEDMLEIYRPIVESSHTSFEYEIPDKVEFSERISRVLERWPWLVARENGKVIAYAYATQLRARVAYSWTIELSVYVQKDHRGRKIGMKLYQSLMELLIWQGARNFMGVIALPNADSEIFHQKLGFRKVAEFPAMGYKKRWIDLAWYLYSVNDDSPPRPLRTMEELRASDIFRQLTRK